MLITNLSVPYLRKWQAKGVHHSPEHGEGIPALEPVLLVLWPVLPAGATFAAMLPLARVNGLS